MSRRSESRIETVLVYVAVFGLLIFAAWCSHSLGLARATQGDIRAIERQIEERCR